MMSLFSSFDKFFFSYQIFTVLMIICFLANNFFFKNMYTFLFNNFMKEILIMILGVSNKIVKSGQLFMIVLFYFILFLNFSSIYSFNFPLTSQLSTVLSLSLIFWCSSFLMSLMFNLNSLLIHFIPSGAPNYLIPFLFLIEIVSNLIRSITLTVRLVANILAGHVLMILLSKIFFVMIGVFPVYIFLNLLEMGVSLIQSYIFCIMLALYLSDLE